MFMISHPGRSSAWALALAAAWAVAACGGGDAAPGADAALSQHAQAAPAASARNLPAGNKIRFMVGQNTPDISAFREALRQFEG